MSPEQSNENLQRWIWACGANCWMPGSPSNERWSHEDNMAACKLGWMIAAAPGAGYMNLFSLGSRASPKSIMETIIRLAPIDPLCQRAVAILTTQKMTHPYVTFSWERDL